jgi:molecular chaperone GrpE
MFWRKKMTQPENTNLETEILEPENLENTDLEYDLDSENSNPLEGMDDGMMAQVQEMMAKMQKADDLERELAELKMRYNRLLGDFDGYRTRTALEAKEAEARGISKAAETLFPVIDDMARAVEYGKQNPQGIVDGLGALQSKLVKLFETLGLEQTGKTGEPFDPAFHEALQVVSGPEDDRIVEVFQTGFRMGERLIRPARVVVSKASN